MKYRHSPEESIVESELPIEPIPEIPVQLTKKESLQVLEEQNEVFYLFHRQFQQGSIQDASMAAAKATQEMDDRIRERRERMLAWRKERQDIKEEKPITQKTFNLDDDEDDTNAINHTEQDQEIIPLSEGELFN